MWLYVSLIDMSDQIIHVKIECVHTKVTFYATFVYGLHTRTDRKPLWSTITRHGQNMSDPWIVMGDFNNYLSPSDKQGGIPIRNHEITDFEECVSNLELIDLRLGCYFTWLKGDVCSKLDRVLVNNSWLMSNVEAFAEFLAPGCISDHSCYIVSLDRYANNAGQTNRFKFFNMWALHGDFLNIVSNA